MPVAGGDAVDVAAAVAAELSEAALLRDAAVLAVASTTFQAVVVAGVDPAIALAVADVPAIAGWVRVPAGPARVRDMNAPTSTRSI